QKIPAVLLPRYAIHVRMCIATVCEISRLGVSLELSLFHLLSFRGRGETRSQAWHSYMSQGRDQPEQRTVIPASCVLHHGQGGPERVLVAREMSSLGAVPAPRGDQSDRVWQHAPRPLKCLSP